jgi:hypothetical protein
MNPFNQRLSSVIINVMRDKRTSNFLLLSAFAVMDTFLSVTSGHIGIMGQVQLKTMKLVQVEKRHVKNLTAENTTKISHLLENILSYRPTDGTDTSSEVFNIVDFFKGRIE